MSYTPQFTTPQTRAPIITIIGAPGVGKNTLAALFPKPVIIAAETTTVYDEWKPEAKPSIFEALKKADKTKNYSPLNEIAKQIRWLKTAEHDFKTVIIDSITALQTLLEDELLHRENAKNIITAAGGYGAGLREVGSWQAKLLYELDELRETRNIAVILLAHRGIRRVKNAPDETMEYSEYTLDLPDKICGNFVLKSDAVFHLHQELSLLGGEKTAKVDKSENRVLITNGSARMGFADAKNPYGLPPEIEVPHGKNPLLSLIPFYKGGKNANG